MRVIGDTAIVAAILQSMAVAAPLKNAGSAAGLRTVSRWIRTRRRFWREYRSGEPELRELLKWAKPSPVAVDIGGNIGIYAYHLQRKAKQVITFEPNPKYVEHIGRLNLRRVRLEPVALSNQVGEATLKVPRLSTGRVDEGMASIEPGVVEDGAVSQAIQVAMRRLDDYALEGVGVIKIDVEGHEESVLDGGMQTIEKSRPVLLIEIEERHSAGSLERIAAKLAALKYNGFFFDKGVMTPLAQFDASRHQQWTPALNNASHKRGSIAYINNFLFLPSERHP